MCMYSVVLRMPGSSSVHPKQGDRVDLMPSKFAIRREPRRYTAFGARPFCTRNRSRKIRGADFFTETKALYDLETSRFGIFTPHIGLFQHPLKMCNKQPSRRTEEIVKIGHEVLRDCLCFCVCLCITISVTITSHISTLFKKELHASVGIFAGKPRRANITPILSSYRWVFKEEQPSDCVVASLRSASELVDLGRDDHASDAGRCKSGENARDEGRDGETGDIATTRGGELAKDTNLDTQRTNVTEAAYSIGGNELGALREVIGVIRFVGKSREGVVLVLWDANVNSGTFFIETEEKLTVITFSAMSLDTLRILPFSRDTPKRAATG